MWGSGSICLCPETFIIYSSLRAQKCFFFFLLLVMGGGGRGEAAISKWILKVQSPFSSLHTSGHPVTADLFKETPRSLGDTYCSLGSLLVSLLGSVTTAALRPWQLTAVIIPVCFLKT